MIITVLGAGSFGTALASLAAENATKVKLFCRDINQANYINVHHKNSKRMTTFALATNIEATIDIEYAFRNTDLIIHTIPSQSSPEFVTRIKAFIPSNIPYVCASKGIHIKTHSLLIDALKSVLYPRASHHEKPCEIPLVVLSGPTFAKELLEKHPMSAVIASDDKWALLTVKKSLETHYFKLFFTNDVIGVELGGALKNPLAICSGIANGLGYGASTTASIITRGCQEMIELSGSLGARKETLIGLSGIGDLILTCNSKLSRNYRFGYALAKGKTIAEAISEVGEVVEGYYTTGEVIKLAKENHIFLPLFTSVNRILTNKLTPSEAVNTLMNGIVTEERFIE